MGRSVFKGFWGVMVGLGLQAYPLPQPQPWVVMACHFNPEPLRWLYVAHQWSGKEGWEEVRQKFHQLLREFKVRRHPSWSASRTLRELCQFLKEGLFHHYEERQTWIDVVFRERRFNCVSSTVLMMIFAQTLHFSVEGLWFNGHVLCRVDLGQGKKMLIDFTQELGDWSHAQVLQLPQVLNLIAQNAIIEAQHAGRMAESLQLAVNRWYMEGDEPNQEAFFQTVVNVLADLNGRSQVREAFQLAQEIQARYGTHPTLERALTILRHNLKLLE